MNLKKVAMWTVGIFLGMMVLSALMGACAGPSSTSANGNPNGSWNGQPGYQNNNSSGWLWGLGGLAAGYGLGKWMNRDKTTTTYPTKPNPDPYKQQIQDKKPITDIKPKQEVKPSAPAPQQKAITSSGSGGYKPSGGSTTKKR